MEIRALTADDAEAVIDLWQVAFGRNDPAGRPARREWFLKHPEWVRGAFLGGRLAAALRLYPFRMSWGGALVPMGGVASVATAVEHRRRGLARALTRSALEDLAARGVGWAGLYPFSGPFYRRMGWARCHEEVEWEACLESLPSPAGSVERLDPPSVGDLDQVYRTWAAGWNGALERDLERWERRLGNFGRPSLLYGSRGPGGRLEGYLQVELAAAEPAVHVLDFAWTSRLAGRSLLGSLKGFAGQARRLRWAAPAGQALLDPDELSRSPALTLRPGMMLRLVDVPAALAALPVPSGRGAVRLETRDDFLPGNQGVFVVEWSSGTLSVRRGRRGGDAVRADVRALAQVLSGFRSPGFAQDHGLLEGSPEGIRRLAGLAGGRLPHCADFF